MKTKVISKKKKDKTRHKSKKLKQKQKQKQVQRQVVNVQASSGGGGGGGYPQYISSAPQSLESKILEFQMMRRMINVNDRDPEQKNIQENAMNKMDENNIYNNAQDMDLQQNIQQVNSAKVPRFSFKQSNSSKKIKKENLNLTPIKFPNLPSLSPVPPLLPKSQNNQNSVPSLNQISEEKVKKKVGRPKKEVKK